MQTSHIKTVAATAFMAASLLFSHLAFADKASIKANLGAARERVVAIINGKGDAKTLAPEIAALSSKIDAEADTVPGFKPVWEQFKTNRDTKIIPAFSGGSADDVAAAKALAMGEQKQLYEKMMGLLN